MSLVQSIFGNVAAGGSKKKSKDNTALTSLFEKTPVETKEKESDDENSSSSSSSSSDSDDSSSSSSSNSSDESNKQNDSPEEPSNKIQSTAAPPKEDDDKKPTAIKQPEQEESNKQQQEDDNEEERTIFVGNLPLSTTRRSLTKLFSEVGKVQSARLRSVAVTGVKVPQNYAGNQNLVKKVCTNTKQLDVEAKSSLQGYVVFANKESVPTAIDKFNNRPLSDENPKATRAIRRIRVDTASPTLDPKRSVFVGNLPYQADEASLQDHFVQGCGLDMNQVRGVRIVRDKQTFQCKGFGYVLLEDATLVATALQRMHQSIYMKRPLRVKVCGKSIKGRRGQAKQQQQERSPRQPYEAPAAEQQQQKPATGAMRRVQKKNKRVRGEKKKGKPGLKPGISKRAASDAKTQKRVKKIQKRISKGMGKTRK